MNQKCNLLIALSSSSVQKLQTKIKILTSSICQPFDIYKSLKNSILLVQNYSKILRRIFKLLPSWMPITRRYSQFVNWSNRLALYFLFFEQLLVCHHVLDLEKKLGLITSKRIIFSDWSWTENTTESKRLVSIILIILQYEFFITLWREIAFCEIELNFRDWIGHCPYLYDSFGCIKAPGSAPGPVCQ